MPRYMASTVTGAGSTTLPIMSLYGGTATRPKLRELAVFNTTTTAVFLKLVRVTTAGTQGTALTEMPLVFENTAALATAFATHTVAPTITAGDLYRFPLAGAVGAGIILTFPDEGLGIPAVANNGLAVVVATGTGQVCDCTMVWDE